MVGTSMGGIAAIAAVAVLGDGTLAAADGDPTAPRGVDVAPRPTVVGVVADSTAPELEIPVATRVRGPAGRFVAARLFDGATRVAGRRPAGDRAVAGDRPARDRAAPAHPWRGRHDGADRGRSPACRVGGRRGRSIGSFQAPVTAPVTPSRAMTTSGGSRTSCALRSAAGAATMSARPESSPIIAAPGSPPGDARDRAPAVED